MPNTPKGLTYPSNASPVAVPADIQELATDVDNIIVPISGGTYSGAVAFLQNPSVPTPTSALHAVNKTYADSINADVTALENELGANPSGTFSTVVERLDTYTDGFGKIGNLLTRNQASGGNALGTTTGFAGGNVATVAYVTSTGIAGPGCIEITATSAANSVAGGTPRPSQGTPVAVEAGNTYTATTTVKYTAGSRTSAKMQFVWWDAGGSPLTPGSIGDSKPIGTTEVVLTVTGVAPANAVAVSVEAIMDSPGAVGDKLATGRWGFWKGTGGQWAMPGTPIVGQSRIAVNNAVDLSGTGAPESKVAAPPGSTWLQVGGAVTVSGNLLWRKVTGTGTTGWTPEGALADTGWRDVSASAANGWTASQLLIRRQGSRIDIVGVANGGAASADDIYPIPTGFRTPSGVRFWGAAAEGGTTSKPVEASGNNANLRSSSRSGSLFLTIAYQTPDAWPTSLPGVVA